MRYVISPWVKIDRISVGKSHHIKPGRRLLRKEETMSKEMYKEVLEGLNKALNTPKRWRRKFIMWVFPEIIPVAESLRKYYWAEHCPHCESTDLESPGMDANRYCNACRTVINQ